MLPPVDRVSAPRTTPSYAKDTSHTRYCQHFIQATQTHQSLSLLPCMCTYPLRWILLSYLVDNAHDGRASLHGLDLLALAAEQQLIATTVVEVEASMERIFHREGVSEGVLRAAEVGHSLSLGPWSSLARFLSPSNRRGRAWTGSA